MEANPRPTESRTRHTGRLVLAIISFIAAFLIVWQAMLLFGTLPVEAEAGGLICALAMMAYVMFLPSQG